MTGILRRSRHDDLDDRRVLITGAASGIGEALARSCHGRGAKVIAVDVDGDAARRLATELGPRAMSARADVTVQDDMVAATELALDRFGGIDVVIANAGVTPDPGMLRRTDPAVIRRVVDINVFGVLHTVQAAADALENSGGHVQITGSCSAFMPGPGGAAYMMSKAALESLARSLRLEMSGSGISVGIAMLGMIDTSLAAKTLDDDPYGQALGAQLPAVLSSRMSPHDASEAICAQMEKRAPRKVVPTPWLPLDLARGALPYLEGLTLKSKSLSRALAELDARQL